MSHLTDHFSASAGGNNSRPSFQFSDRIPVSYHRQPGSPTEGNSPTGGDAFSLDAYNSNDLDLALLAHPMDVDMDTTFLHTASSGVDYSAHPRITGPTNSLSLPQDIMPAFQPHYTQQLYGSNLSSSGSYVSTLPPMIDMRRSTLHTPGPGDTDSSSEEQGGAYASIPPLPFVSLPPHYETEAYLRKSLGIDANIPVDLHALPDVIERKQPPITNMILLAIWGSQHKRLTLRQIYEEVEKRYPSLGELHDKPWQRSIRHNLSLKAIFVRVERPANEPGKGHYWAIDVRQGDGNKRDRRRKETSAGPSRSRSDEEDLSEGAEDDRTPAVSGRQGDRRGFRTRDSSYAQSPYPVEASGSSARMSTAQSRLPYQMGAPPRFLASQPYPSLPLNTSLSNPVRSSSIPNLPRPYSLPPNIEHRPLQRSTFDSYMGMDQMSAGSYGGMPPHMSITPITDFHSSPYMGSVPFGHHNNTGTCARRPAPDEEVERSTRRRPRTT